MATAVIGLGSNLQRPLVQLRAAFQKLTALSEIDIQAYSSIYLSQPLLAGQPFYLNAAVKIKTALTPEALLRCLKEIEQALGRTHATRWASRIIDLDLLCFDQLQLHSPSLALPHPELIKRSFAVIPLLEVWPDYHHPTHTLAALTWPDPLQRLPQGLTGTEMVGILNITPDSFSDGGRYCDAEKAVAQAARLFEQGASVIDIGAESTRPGAILIDHATEWQRLEPILSALKQHWGQTEHRPLISIDTRHAATAEKCLDYGIDWINDQSQAEFSAMIPLLKTSLKTGLKYVAMHHETLPPRADQLTHGDPIRVLQEFQQNWQQRFDDAGLARDQLILDPGIGFGKSTAAYLAIFKRFDMLQSPQTQWMIGHSRKSFLRHFFPGMDIAKSATATLSAYLGKKNLSFLRVHEPADSLAAIRLTELLS